MSEILKEKHFNPKAHILTLLGEELIKSPVMAIYELVKNSYDADATKVDVFFRDIDDLEKGAIIIEDDGLGMTTDIVENVWLEPGTDNRKPYNIETGKRQVIKSPVFKRVPMGEKGVGRFAVHKLAQKILLISRPKIITINENTGEIESQTIANYEVELFINWKDFSQSINLSEIPIRWKIKKDEKGFRFKNNSGTYIRLSGLKENWTRRMARGLKRNTLSMLSPKNDETKFRINLDFGNNWLEGFPDSKKVLEIAPYKYTALLDDEFNLTVDYKFSLELNPEFGERTINSAAQNIKGLLRPKLREKLEDDLIDSNEVEQTLNELVNKNNPFGNILIEVYSFDLDSDTLKNYTYDAKTVKEVLKMHSGVKVFKDEMRVFNYGDPGDDWLELDIRRVQNKQWFSNNQIIGYIYLDSENSTELIEKTNREGFIDNEQFKLFYEIVVTILTDFRNERLTDRNKWLSNIKPVSKSYSNPNQISLFKELIDSTNFSEEDQKKKLKDEADKIEKDFEDKKNTLLIPAGVGMTASVALHELEKLVPRMKEVINSKPFKVNIANEQVEEMHDYLNGILSVLRKGGISKISVHDSINKAISNYRTKFETRGLHFNLDYSGKVNKINCDKRYFITMIMNILDNSMHWLDTIYKDNKGVYIKTMHDDFPSIIIADNGPGFKDDITDIVRPFFSRKEDGIGIGLYLVDTIMLKYGKLNIIEVEEDFMYYDIPSDYRGAALKLTFNKNQ
ncbi:sensor histidine kinase [Marinilabilia salmonicolor]|uniref:sensor histidine kinase n=1 Tax=Marinilabilia salmonicolor TaxID=989 RepID=UPI00029A00BF|nr:sensor histidine kinase [Marinilabilia salmonicolor]